MADYGGMASRLKLMAVFWVFITMASIGLPGLNGFVSETLSMMGMYAFQRPEVPGWLLSGLATGGIVLGAWYMLKLLRRVFFGELKEPAHEGHGSVADLNVREVAALAPLAALCLFLGVWSQSFLDTVRPDLLVVARIAEGAKARAADWNSPVAASEPPASAVAKSGDNVP
jgi:NADH-quinone oxidoreductase subunit M